MSQARVRQIALLAIATAQRLAALTARSGALAAVDPACLRVRGGFRSRARSAFPLDGLVTQARRGAVSVVATEDAPLAATLAAGRVPLVCVAPADEHLFELVAVVAPNTVALVADDDTSAAYLALARSDLGAAFSGTNVLATRLTARQSDQRAGETILAIDAWAEARLRWGLAVSGGIERSGSLLAELIVERASHSR